MADRYWVGGTATWDGTAGTKWSTTSGGAGGASVPTLNDDVYFDQNSNSGTNTFTVTISSSRVCRNITVQNLDGAMTLAGTGSLSVYGNLTFPSTGLTVSNTGTLTIRGQSSVVNTGGVLINNISLGSRTLTRGSVVTESVTLAGSLNVSNSLFIGCDLNTQGFTIQSAGIELDQYTMTLNFSNSHIIVSRYFVNYVTNYTPEITLITTNTDITFSNPILRSSFDLYPLEPSFRNVTVSVTVEYPVSANICVFRTKFNAENLIIPEIASNRLYVVFNSDCIISNTIDIQSTANPNGKKRVSFISSFENEESFGWNLGGTNLYATNVDFYGINITASNVNCVRCGDLGFNSGIQFDNSRTLYWAGSASDVWSDSKWSLVQNQAGIELYPLAQDDVIIDDFSSSTISVDKSASVKNLTINRSTPVTLSYTGPTGFLSNATVGTFNNTFVTEIDPGIKITGDLTFPLDRSLVTLQLVLRFYGPGIKNIRSLYLPTVIIDTYEGIVRIHNDIEFLNFRIASGTFDSNGFNIKATSISSVPVYPYTTSIGSPPITNVIGSMRVRQAGQLQWLYFFDRYKVTKHINFENSIVECNEIQCVAISGLIVASLYALIGYNPPTEINFTNSSLILKGASNYLDGRFDFSGVYPPNPTRLATYNLNTVIIANTETTFTIQCDSINNFDLDRSGSFTLDFGEFPPLRESINLGSWGISGSAGQTITLSAQSKLNKTSGGIVQTDYLNISNSVVQPPDTWYAGANSVNAGNNINWIFANPYDPETSGDFFIMFE